MLSLKSYLLLSTAVATALFHTLIPDHWLPFVLIGRARGWTVRTTAMISGLSAMIHTALSIGLGLGAVKIGTASAHAIGETLARSSAVLLILFGLLYAVWAWRKGGHFHPGGGLFHSSTKAPGCEGKEGDSHPEHLHYHADGEWIHGPNGHGGTYLAVIVGMNPCILVMPIMLSSVEKGATTVALVIAAYSVTTIILMMGLSVAGVVGIRRIRLPGVARYMEMASGMVIALTGVVFWLLES